MNQQKQVLICKLSECYLGFNIESINQVLQKKQAQINSGKDEIRYRGFAFPYIDLIQLFQLDDANPTLILLLNSDTGAFGIPIENIKGIIDVENNDESDMDINLSNFVTVDYAKNIILFNELPVAVIDTNKLAKIQVHTL